MMVLNAEMTGHLFSSPLPSRVMHFMLPVYAVVYFLLAPGRQRLGDKPL